MLYHSAVIDLLATSILSGSLVQVCVRVQKKNYSINVANRHYLFPISANHHSTKQILSISVIYTTKRIFVTQISYFLFKTFNCSCRDSSAQSYTGYCSCEDSSVESYFGNCSCEDSSVESYMK